MEGVGQPLACSWCGTNVIGEECRGQDRQRLRESACPGALRMGEVSGHPGLSPDPLAACTLSSSPMERPSAQARMMPPAACLTCEQTRS